MKTLGVLLSGLAMIASHAEGNTSKLNKKEIDSAQHLGLGLPWKTGEVSSQLSEAKRLKIPVLLYWGAVWCPPCNELKSQVFQKSEFKQATQNIALVYLDGDAPNAQKWADKLGVSGYPTLLLLNSDGKELSRFDGALNVSEFTNALNAATQVSSTLAELLFKFASKNNLSPAEWKVLSVATWEDTLLTESTQKQLLQLQNTNDGFKPNLLEILTNATAKIPEELVIEKSLLAAKTLLMAADSKPTDKGFQEVFANKTKLIEFIFQSDATKFANRSFILGATQSMIDFFSEDKEKQAANFVALENLKKTWIAAAEFIQKQPDSSLDTIIWSHYPEVLFAKKSMSELDVKNFQYTSELKSKIVAVADLADKKATSDFLRKSVISGAANLLSKVGEFSKARELLQKELVSTSTPWYVQSAMGEVEKTAGNLKEALRWHAQAAKSAVGDSTTLQWQAAYIAQLAKLNENSVLTEEKELVDAVKSYYGSVFSTKDAFFGRNAGRQVKLVSTFNDLIEKKGSQKLLITTLSTLETKCAKMTSEESKLLCKKHFESIKMPNQILASEKKKSTN